MYSKNCIYDYVQVNISDGDVDYESGTNVLRYTIPQGAYYDIKRGPVASVALVEASADDEALQNYSVKWLNPSFNSYNTNNDGIYLGNLVHFATSGVTHGFKLNHSAPVEVMTTPKPNTIRFVVTDEDNDTFRLDSGYFIFRFTYYDQDMVDMNLRNESYKRL